MHRFNKTSQPSLIQGKSGNNKDRFIYSIERDTIERFNLDFSPKHSSLIGQFVDELNPPNISESDLDHTLELLSTKTGFSLLAIELIFQGFKSFAINGPIPSSVTDLIKPNPISGTSKLYFKNVADSAIFREDIDWSRYSSYNYKRTLSSNLAIIDYMDLESSMEQVLDKEKSSENELSKFLLKNSFTFDQPNIDTNTSSFNDSETTFKIYSELNEPPTSSGEDNYRDSVMGERMSRDISDRSHNDNDRDMQEYEDRNTA
jgi:hypothetical protein